MQRIFICLFIAGLAAMQSIFAQPQDTTSCTKTTVALEQATTILSALSTAQKRDSITINSLVNISRKAHDDALSCKSHLTAMMILATSESARKLLAADNILMFRMAVRDTRLFLDEAKRYWEKRQ
ncbi:MAG: hypothetical protein ACOVSW_06900 [Candidatus Kapaibacteriota bacterium]|jgi:hypothetical protein